MAKTEKELQELKEKVEELNRKLKELSKEELQQVAGGLINSTDGLSLSDFTGEENGAVLAPTYLKYIPRPDSTGD